MERSGHEMPPAVEYALGLLASALEAAMIDQERIPYIDIAPIAPEMPSIGVSIETTWQDPVDRSQNFL